MLTITAVTRAKKGSEVAMRQALIAVADHVQANEPDTIGFFVSQDASDSCVFRTYERFADKSAMDRHNGSEVVARFFGIAKPILDGNVILVTASKFRPSRKNRRLVVRPSVRYCAMSDVPLYAERVVSAK